jgi:hypothetical protein
MRKHWVGIGFVWVCFWGRIGVFGLETGKIGFVLRDWARVWRRIGQGTVRGWVRGPGAELGAIWGWVVFIVSLSSLFSIYDTQRWCYVSEKTPDFGFLLGSLTRVGHGLRFPLWGHFERV